MIYVRNMIIIVYTNSLVLSQHFSIVMFEFMCVFSFVPSHTLKILLI
jgi:hypothetical protein